MNINIENFFGNDVIKLNYCFENKVITYDNIVIVGEIANNCGYVITDVDCDEDDNDFIRLQQVNVDNTAEEEKKDLLELINSLNKRFL